MTVKFPRFQDSDNHDIKQYGAAHALHKDCDFSLLVSIISILLIYVYVFLFW